jgi:hypothetical protein
MFRKLLAILSLAVSSLLMPGTVALVSLAPSTALAAECTLYEQSHPAFTLDGSHMSTGKCSTCASCHLSGIFIGTPKTCIACHNGDPLRVTVGRSPQHIPTTVIDCNNCHTTGSFLTNFNMNHTAVAGQRCDTCHTGTFKAVYNADGKPNTHVPTTSDCGTCHQSRTAWGVQHEVLHAGVTTGCVTCHDGSYAVGKSNYAPGHPLTSDQCETCHSINANFKCASLGDLMKNFAFIRKAFNIA